MVIKFSKLAIIIELKISIMVVGGLFLGLSDRISNSIMPNLVILIELEVVNNKSSSHMSSLIIFNTFIYIYIIGVHNTSLLLKVLEILLYVVSQPQLPKFMIPFKLRSGSINLNQHSISNFQSTLVLSNSS